MDDSAELTADASRTEENATGGRPPSSLHLAFAQGLVAQGLDRFGPAFR
jgi:hypothetical protein